MDRSVVEQRVLEESCRLPAEGAVTGWAALRLHGAGYFDGLADDGRAEVPVPLLVPPPLNLAPTAGSAVRRERLDPGERMVVQGVPVTAPARAAFDAARMPGDLRGAVVALDMALAAGAVTQVELTRLFTAKPGWAGVRLVQRAVVLSDARSMSPKETLLRLIWILDAGLPRPRSNWPVSYGDGRFIGRPDLLCTENGVVGEFDGAGHRSRDQHREDLRRDDLFKAVGLEPFRVVGADLDDRDLVLARIRAAVGRAERATVPRTWRVKANPRPVA